MTAEVRALRPPPAEPPRVVRDPEILRAYLEDASSAPPGSALGLVRPDTVEQAAALLADPELRGSTLLFQAARSSLTGGAVPAGGLVVSVERMDSIGALHRSDGGATIEVQPGVRLHDLQSHLAERGLYFPPVPTYREAMVGGVVSTNAGGAASFKYGVTRDWVQGLAVLLAGGALLRLERGQVVAGSGAEFRIELPDGGVLRVPVPRYRLPPLKKISAGYHAAEPLDLVDLFIGAEGTLGMIVGATLRVVPAPAATVTGLAYLPHGTAALDLAGALRSAAGRVRDGSDPSGPDVRAIESFDRACLDLLRGAGADRAQRVAVPPDAGAALLFEMELGGTDEVSRVEPVLDRFLEGRDVGDHPLARLLSLLGEHGALDRLELALTADERRHEQLRALREAVPARVSEILADRRRRDPAVQKVGGDLIVPFEHLPEMIAIYERGFAERGLEFAVWGHVSDGNLHPNALPHSAAQVRAANEALLAFADEAVLRGGAPLSEHGVGRNAVKQRMLRRFLGADALEQMRAIKAALDPAWRLAPGVLFPAPDTASVRAPDSPASGVR